MALSKTANLLAVRGRGGKAEVEALVAARHVHLEVPEGPPQAGEPGFPFHVPAYKYAVVVAEALIEGAVPQAAADDSAVNPPALQVAHDPCGVAARLRQLKRLWRWNIYRLGKKRGGAPAAERLHSGDEILPPHLYEIVQGGPPAHVPAAPVPFAVGDHQAVMAPGPVFPGAGLFQLARLIGLQVGKQVPPLRLRDLFLCHPGMAHLLPFCTGSGPRASLARSLPPLMGRPFPVLVGSGRGLPELSDGLQYGACFLLLVLGRGPAYPVFLRYVLPPGVAFPERLPVPKHIAAGDEAPGRVQVNVPPVGLVIEIVPDMFGDVDCADFLHAVAPEGLVIPNPRIEVIAVQVLRQVDQIPGPVRMLPEGHCGLEFLQLAPFLHFLQHMRQIVELVQAGVLVQAVIQPQHVAVIAGDEILPVPFPVYANPGEQGPHFLRGRGEAQGLPGLHAKLRVKAGVRHIGFKHFRMFPPFRPGLRRSRP